MRAISFAPLIAIALVSLPVTSPAQAAKLEKPTISLSVGGRNLVAYLPLTIADRVGFFKKHGLNVVISDFAGGSKALQALVGGSANIACGAYEHTIFLQAKSEKVKVIALQNDSFGLVIGVQKKLAASYKGPQSLKGLKIGVTSPGSASAIGLGLYLHKVGLSLNDVSVIGVGGGARAVAAMNSGQVDALANFDPAISMLQSDGALVPVLDTRNEKDLVALYGGAYAGSAFLTTPSFIKANPNTIQAFADAIHDALVWIAKASTDQIVDAVPKSYYGKNRALYHTVIDKNRGRFLKDGIVTMTQAETVLRAISQSHPKLTKAHIDLAQTFDNSFMEKAKAESAH
jgi:NitT/TauT family transport system substrate-binding protein